MKLALDLDGVLGDTRALWNAWLDDAARRYRAIAPLDPRTLPNDRAAAARELDRWAAGGVGDWRAALGRFADDHAPLFLRPDGETTSALRLLQAAGARLAAFSDAPEPLARVAVAHLAAARRVEAVVAEDEAEQRALARLGDGARVIRSRQELLELAAAYHSGS